MLSGFSWSEKRPAGHQHFVYQRLIANASATRFFATLIEYSRINANGNELPGPVAQRRAADAAHA